jgi:hypothetical protein
MLGEGKVCDGKQSWCMLLTLTRGKGWVIKDGKDGDHVVLHALCSMGQP